MNSVKKMVHCCRTRENYLSFLARKSMKMVMFMPRKNQGQSTMVAIPLQGQRESTQGKKSENLELMTSMSQSHH